MGRVPAWVATWFAVEGLALGLSFGREPIRDWSVAGWAAGALISALWWCAAWTAFSWLGRGRWFVALVGSAALISLLAVNVRLWLELGEFVTPSMLALPGSGGGPRPADIPSWLAGYLPPVGWLAAGLATAGHALLWVRSRRRGPLAAGLLAGVGALVGLGWLGRERPLGHLPPDVATFAALASIGAAPAAPPPALVARRPAPVGPAVQAPSDVLVIVVESWSRSRLAAYGGPAGAMPSLEARLAREPGAWTVFERAYTVATATELVLEALLTGISPAASSEVRGTAPILWSFAQAAGHQTLFVTPQNLAWGALPQVLGQAQIDTALTRTELGGPRRNDLGADELLAADAMAGEIRARPQGEPLVAVYLSNALHEPFQARSPRFSGPLRGSRYARALRLNDAGLERILTALTDSGRLERTLVVLIGDHGVTLDRAHALPRLYGFYEEFVHVPMMLRLPASLRDLRPGAQEALVDNADALVSTLDVLPTVLDALGRPEPELEGASLLRPVPLGREVVAVNANDRRRWEHEGFAIVTGELRFLYTDLEGAQLFRVDTDPGQRTDLWPTAEPAIRAQIARVLRERPVLREIVRGYPPADQRSR